MYAGLIRGAIAFGLVTRIDEGASPNRSVVVTTALALVIFTTVVFGSTVGILQKMLFNENEPQDTKSDVKDSFKLVQANEGEDDDFNESVDLSNESSEYQQILHPNQEAPEKKQVVRSGCIKYLYRFDELIMKPIFIYKYEKDMQKKSQEFFELFMKNGEEIEKDFHGAA